MAGRARGALEWGVRLPRRKPDVRQGVLVRRLLPFGLFLSLLVFAAAGCSDDLTDLEIGGPSGTVTETLAGPLTPAGGSTHVFVVSGKGAITARLTAVGDDNTRVVGLALGNWNNNACQLAAANDNSFVDSPLAATVSAAGSICARVYDSKGVPDATSYVLEVIHP